MAKWGTHLPMSMKDLGLIPGTGTLAWVTTYKSSLLSLGPLHNGRLKNFRDVNKWSSLSLSLPVRRMSVTRTWAVHVHSG